MVRHGPHVSAIGTGQLIWTDDVGGRHMIRNCAVSILVTYYNYRVFVVDIVMYAPDFGHLRGGV